MSSSKNPFDDELQHKVRSADLAEQHLWELLKETYPELDNATDGSSAFDNKIAEAILHPEQQDPKIAKAIKDSEFKLLEAQLAFSQANRAREEKS